MNERIILNQKWDKFVGRRESPFRVELEFGGALRWLRKNGFNGDYSELLLYYSVISENGIISDCYINNKIKKRIVTKFKLALKGNPLYANKLLMDFKIRISNLQKFSLQLKSIPQSNKKFGKLFEKFCLVWEEFGPVLQILLLLIEACEEIILKDSKDLKTKTHLMEYVSSKVRSKYFKLNRNKKKTKLIFSAKHAPYIALLSELMEFRDYRKIIYDNCWYNLSARFFNRLKKITARENETYFLSKKEFLNLINEKKPLSEKVILSPALTYFKENKCVVIYGKKATKIHKIIWSMMNRFEGVLKGMVASTGIATGRVRLIWPHAVNQRFKDNEILVTSMTTPDLMPFLKKASAIITDEGGITSHAAIVSRELNKPCIIGTKIATKVLKNGDLIQVDANKGIIKKL